MVCTWSWGLLLLLPSPDWYMVTLKQDIRGDERGSNPREHQGLQDGYHGSQHGYQVYIPGTSHTLRAQ